MRVLDNGKVSKIYYFTIISEYFADIWVATVIN